MIYPKPNDKLDPLEGARSDLTPWIFVRAAGLANLLVATLVFVEFSGMALVEHDPRAFEIGLWLVPFVTLVIWASAVVLFNLALNTRRGTVEPRNGCPGCTAEATINQQTGTYSLGLNYYQLGQASHFIARGAVRIGTRSYVSYAIGGNDPQIATPGLDDVAVQNPNGSKVSVQTVMTII